MERLSELVAYQRNRLAYRKRTELVRDVETIAANLRQSYPESFRGLQVKNAMAKCNRCGPLRR